MLTTLEVLKFYFVSFFVMKVQFKFVLELCNKKSCITLDTKNKGRKVLNIEWNKAINK